MKKAMITVIGKDKIGIIAAVSTRLCENSVNILDISQTILQEYFTMVMLVDIAGWQGEFSALKENIVSLGEEIGVSIKIQRADIFDAMHKI